MSRVMLVLLGSLVACSHPVPEDTGGFLAVVGDAHRTREIAARVDFELPGDAAVWSVAEREGELSFALLTHLRPEEARRWFERSLGAHDYRVLEPWSDVDLPFVSSVARFQRRVESLSVWIRPAGDRTSIEVQIRGLAPARPGAASTASLR